MIIAAKEEMEHGTETTAGPAIPWSRYIPRIRPEYLDFDYRISPELEKWRSWVSGLGVGEKGKRFCAKVEARCIVPLQRCLK